MRFAILAASITLAATMTGPVLAADALVDLPVASTYNWTGAYVGAVVTYGWGHTNALDNNFPSANISYSGALGGLTLGYNKQFGSIVAGLEGDISFGRIKGSGPGGDDWGCGGNCTFSTSWLGTARGRIGYAFNSIMPYATAGLAFGHTSGRLDGFASNPDWNGSDTRFGWAIGGGLEVAIDSHWSVKGEYLYTDLGKSHFGDGNGGDGFEAKFKTNTVRVGLNYKF